MELRRRDGGVVAVEIVGSPAATPVLFCHGLADSRLTAHRLAPAADELGLRLIAPDRPGTGGTDPRRLDQVVDWVDDAIDVLDALDIPTAHVLGISGGGAFAAACAARMPARFVELVLVAPLGPPEWPTDGMAPWQRRSLRLAALAPGFGGWFLAQLATLGRIAPQAYVRVVTAEMPPADRHALERTELREDFLTAYLEAFRQGSAGVEQDLRLLTRSWGFDLDQITVPTVVHHGTADTTVPLDHARRFVASIPYARLELHADHGHFSIATRSAWMSDRARPSDS